MHELLWLHVYLSNVTSDVIDNWCHFKHRDFIKFISSYQLQLRKNSFINFFSYKIHSYFVSVSIDNFIAKSAETSLLAEGYADMFTIDAHALLNERLGLQNYCMDSLKILVLEINKKLHFSKVHTLSFAQNALSFRGDL